MCTSIIGKKVVNIHDSVIVQVFEKNGGSSVAFFHSLDFLYKKREKNYDRLDE